MISLENTHTCNIIQTEQVTLRNIYAHNNNERRGRDFEKQHGGVCGRVWRETKEGEVIIIHLKNKIINNKSINVEPLVFESRFRASTQRK